MTSTAAFLNDVDRRSFRRIFNIIGRIREVDEAMPISQASVLTWVALNEGKTQVDLRRDLDMASSTSSRNIAALSAVHRLGKPGLGLIEWRDNPEDRRSKNLYLTPKGRLLVARLLEPLT